MSTSTYTQDDIAMGAKVISYATQLLGFIASMALASACSSAIMAILVGIISGFVLSLLASVASFYVVYKLDAKHVAAVGSTTNSVMFKLGSLFARKGAAA